MADAPGTIREFDEKMKKSVGVVGQELAALRTGRASAALVENIRVEVYGSAMPLKQLASVSVPEARTIEIRPWDKANAVAIEKAISSSDLKLTPQRQGDMVRLVLPQLTGERRNDLAKVAKKMAEDGRVAIRNLRHELNNRLKAVKDQGGVSEDEFRRLTQQSQKMTDAFIARIDENLATKEKEILTV